MTLCFKTWLETNAQTPEFAQWFAGSKIVDAAGNPKIVYHGTWDDFENFDNKLLGQNSEGVATAAFGHWFFGDKKDIGYYKRDNPGANVYPAYLNIKNPYTMRDDEFDEYEIPDNERFGGRDFAEGDKKRRQLIASSYDGIIVPELEWICAFDSKQIRRV